MSEKKGTPAVKNKQVIVEATVVKMVGKEKGDKVKMELSTARACAKAKAVTFTEPK